MKRLIFGLLLLLFIFPTPAYTQLWSGVVDSNRAIDWSVSAGIPGGIPSGSWANCTTTACNTLWNNGVDGTQVTAANINAAIASALDNTVVRVPGNGTSRTINDKITFNRDNVALRGQGANQTILHFTGDDGCANTSCTVHIVSAGNWSGVPEHTASFLGAGNPPVSGTYTKGATQILVNSNSGMSVGQFLILDQLDDASDTGNIYLCGREAADCSAEGASSGGGRGDVRSLLEFTEIMNINGTTITIRQPLRSSNWRSSQQPGVWWATTPRKYCGIEDMTVDATAISTGAVVLFENGNYGWVKGVKSLKSTGGRTHISEQYSSGIIVRDSYLFGTPGGAESYGVETWMSGNALIENNIIEQGVVGFLVGAGVGSVAAYNYIVNQNSTNDGWLYPAVAEHDPGTSMMLYEGNDTYSMMQDEVHGTHAMATFFRNRMSGFDDTQYMQTVPLIIMARSRYTNIIGNIFGRAGYHTGYQNNVNGGGATCDTAIYNLGWGATGCSNNVPSEGSSGDSLAVTTSMRWGNYDVITGTVRWCGNSGSTGWATTCSSTSEVPTGAPAYPNTVPATETLPNSFYLSSQPTSWWATPWGTPHWPPFGPDVTGGNISEGSGGEAGLDGHAYKIPARLCYENTSKTGGILNFNASACYLTAVPSLSGVTGVGISIR